MAERISPRRHGARERRARARAAQLGLRRPDATTARSRSRPGRSRSGSRTSRTRWPARASAARRDVRAPAGRPAARCRRRGFPTSAPASLAALAGGAFVDREAPSRPASRRPSRKRSRRPPRPRAGRSTRCAARRSPSTTAPSTSRSGATSTESRATREHERCGSHLVGPLLVTTAPGSLVARAAPPQPRLLARAGAAVGAMAASVEVFSWMVENERHPVAKALARPGHELQQRVLTAEPSAEQLEVAQAALAECLRLEQADAAAAYNRTAMASTRRPGGSASHLRSSTSRSRRCGRATTRTRTSTTRATTLLADEPPPARRHAGLPEEARRPRRDGRGDRDPQALLGRLGGADRPRALRRGRDPPVRDGDDDRGRLHALRPPRDRLPRRPRPADARLDQRPPGRRGRERQADPLLPGPARPPPRADRRRLRRARRGRDRRLDRRAGLVVGRHGDRHACRTRSSPPTAGTPCSPPPSSPSTATRRRTSSSSSTSRTTPCGPSLEVARALGDRLWGVRLDTSRTLVDRSLWSEMGYFDPRGVNPRLVEKVRGALDAEGFERVKIVVSGGFDVERIREFEAQGRPGRLLRGRLGAPPRRERLHGRHRPDRRAPLGEGRPALRAERAARARRMTRAL